MALDRKIAYINLSTGEVEIKPIPLELRKKFIGGRGMDAYLLYNHAPEGCDPVGPENPLIVSGGLLTATCASATARTHVMAKSPLTNLLGSCNMGGFFAPEMAWAGFHHLVITGKADKPVYLWIHNGTIEIRDAGHLWGKNSTDTQWAIREELDDQEIKSMVIGQAGENLVTYACVMTGIKNAGGRTGMGCVMGSKNLKAVAVRGTMDVKIAHPVDALEHNKKFIEQITSAKVNQIQGALGTPFIWGATNCWGGVRTRNFQYNQMEYADEIEPEAIDDIATETIGPHHMTGCFGCQVHCRAQYKIQSGLYAGKYDEGPEYTSLGAFGAEPDCKSAQTVLTGNHLVNQYGVDNLEIGSMIAWAMELYELGILTQKETEGLDLRFGNDEALLQMVHNICTRTGWLGNVLADGGIPAAEKIGKNSFDYLIQVKGMNNLHSDERATPGLALNIATASRGSDHLRSRPAIDLYHLPEPVLRKIYGSPVPYDGPLSSEHTEYIGKPWQVFWQENVYMAVDCLGICKYHTVFLGATLPNFEDWPKVIYYNTGLEFTPKEIWDAAERCNNLERLFNIREGLTRNDLKKGDTLNHRYFDEPCRRGAPDVIGKKIDRDKFNTMIDEFYEHHGWDKQGVPTSETLQRLGLENEPTRLLLDMYEEKTMEKFLTVDADKCTGCRLCEQVCSVMHEGVSNPAKSRIQVVKWEQEGIYIPVICKQCEDAPCMNVCPVRAISRDPDFGFVKVDQEVCIGCRSCVGICPFGAMGYNMNTHQVFKCDLCGGDPQCVRFCDVKAVDFVSADRVTAQKKRRGAARQSAAERQAVALG